MSWNVLLENDAGPGVPLRTRIEALFAQQRADWPALREGEAALASLRRKTLTSADDWILVQLNPARRRSTQAKTDAQSIAARPCFLCPQNMPVEERGVAFEDFVVLPNPFPILPRHCTIAHRDHRPQLLDGQLEKLLQLAAEIGPEMAAFYNGARCGASAPDHLHFQATESAAIPILQQLPIRLKNRDPVLYENFGRSVVVFRGTSVGQVAGSLQQAIDNLPLPEGGSDEAMFNLLARFTAGQFTALLFPRRAHRPNCYFAEGDAQIGVSPAVLEMAGILVVTDDSHYQRLDAEAARCVYQQVGTPAAELEKSGLRPVS